MLSQKPKESFPSTGVGCLLASMSSATSATAAGSGAAAASGLLVRRPTSGQQDIIYMFYRVSQVFSKHKKTVMTQHVNTM